jgi:hypothetical protein
LVRAVGYTGRVSEITYFKIAPTLTLILFDLLQFSVLSSLNIYVYVYLNMWELDDPMERSVCYMGRLRDSRLPVRAGTENNHSSMIMKAQWRVTGLSVARLVRSDLSQKG